MGGVAKAITAPIKAVKKVVKKAGPVLGMMAANAIAPGSGFALAAGAGIGGLAGGYGVKNSLLMAGTAYALSPGGLGGLGKLSEMAGQGGIKGFIGNVASKAGNVSKGIGQWFNNTGVGQKLTEFGAKMGVKSAQATLESQVALGQGVLGPGSAEAAKMWTPTLGETAGAGVTQEAGLTGLGTALGEPQMFAPSTMMEATAPSLITGPGAAPLSDAAARSLAIEYGKALKPGMVDPETLKVAGGIGGLSPGQVFLGASALGALGAQEEIPPQTLADQTYYPGDDPWMTAQNPTGMYSLRPGGVMRGMFGYDYPDYPSRGPNLLPPEWFGLQKGGIINNLQQGGPPTIMDFPRRTGPISGPGTGTSDSVPAMLSDGEFVMTSRAVRNAGGGSRELGARKMYNLMDNLERGVA